MRVLGSVLVAALLLATPALPPARASGAASPTAAWVWPIGGASSVIGEYRAPAHRYAAGHRGIDIAAAAGSPVVAPADGEVYFAGTVVDRPIVTIRTDEGVLASLEPVAASVAEGSRVAQGQLIGTVAAGGHCSERCAHLGARVDGDYVSPLRFLGGIPRAVLLPLD